jgi:hypothetical protein
LGETVDARRDVAVEAARDGGRSAGAGHQEHRLVAFDHRLSRADIPCQVVSYSSHFLKTTRTFDMPVVCEADRSEDTR